MRLLLLLLVTATALAADAPLVEVRDDRLTVHLEKVPVETVIAEIGRASGAEIRGRVREPREVSGDYDGVPLPEALHRLLGEQNFTLTYGDQGRLRAIKLLGGPQEPPPTLVTAPAAPPSTAPNPANLADLLQHHPPVRVDGVLAQALGTENVTLTQLVDTALHHADAGVRSDAVRTGVRAIEADAPLRDAIVSAVGTLDDQVLTTVLRNAAGEHASEVVAQMLGTMHTPELRKRALALLPTLRAAE